MDNNDSKDIKNKIKDMYSKLDDTDKEKVDLAYRLDKCSSYNQLGTIILQKEGIEYHSYGFKGYEYLKDFISNEEKLARTLLGKDGSRFDEESYGAYFDYKGFGKEFKKYYALGNNGWVANTNVDYNRYSFDDTFEAKEAQNESIISKPKLKIRL